MLNWWCAKWRVSLLQVNLILGCLTLRTQLMHESLTLTSPHTHTCAPRMPGESRVMHFMQCVGVPHANEYAIQFFQCGLSVGSGYDVGFCGSCNMEDAERVSCCCCYSLLMRDLSLPSTIATMFVPTSSRFATNPRLLLKKGSENYVYAVIWWSAAVFRTLCLMCVFPAPNCACQRQQRAVDETVEKQSQAVVRSPGKPALDLFDISAMCVDVNVDSWVSLFMEIAFKVAHVFYHYHSEFRIVCNGRVLWLENITDKK